MANPLGQLAIIKEPPLSTSSESPYIARLPRLRFTSLGGAVTIILGSKIGIFITLSRSLVDSCLFTKATMVSSDCFEVKSSKASLIKFLQRLLLLLSGTFLPSVLSWAISGWMAARIVYESSELAVEVMILLLYCIFMDSFMLILGIIFIPRVFNNMFLGENSSTCSTITALPMLPKRKASSSENLFNDPLLIFSSLIDYSFLNYIAAC